MSRSNDTENNRTNTRKHRRKVAAKVAVATALVGSMNAAAAADYYLKLGDIEGEVTTKGVEGTIELDSFSFGTSIPFDGTGRQTGPQVYRSVRIIKPIDTASPALFRYVTTQTVSNASIVGYDQDLEGRSYKRVEVKLADTVVESVSLGAETNPSAQARGMTTLSLKYAAGCVTTYNNSGAVTGEECFDVGTVAQ